MLESGVWQLSEEFKEGELLQGWDRLGGRRGLRVLITINYLNPEQNPTSRRLPGIGVCVVPNFVFTFCGRSLQPRSLLQFTRFASSQHPMHLPASSIILERRWVEIHAMSILLPQRLFLPSASETHVAGWTEDWKRGRPEFQLFSPAQHGKITWLIL